jgi:REP element-mobilizing transposase RayT
MWFGEITGESHLEAKMSLNEFGNIACNELEALSSRFTNMRLDVFQIMPNHIHAIFFLAEPVVRADYAAEGHDYLPTQAKPLKLGDIIGAYKSLVSLECLKTFLSEAENQTVLAHMGKLWQRNYHEHIIQNEEEYNRIASYITSNPANWQKDKFYMAKR